MIALESLSSGFDGPLDPTKLIYQPAHFTANQKRNLISDISPLLFSVRI